MLLVGGFIIHLVVAAGWEETRAGVEEMELELETGAGAGVEEMGLETGAGN